MSEQVHMNWMKSITAHGLGLPLVAFRLKLPDAFVQLCSFTKQVFDVILGGLQIH